MAHKNLIYTRLLFSWDAVVQLEQLSTAGFCSDWLVLVNYLIWNSLSITPA